MSTIITGNINIGKPVNDDAPQYEPPGRPRKKRRRLDAGTDSVKARLALEAGSVEQWPEAEPPSTLEIDPDNDSIQAKRSIKCREDEASLSDSDRDDQTQSFLPQSSIGTVNRSYTLSDFSSTLPNTLNESEESWRVSLGRKDTLAILGQYDLYIRKGAVSISGALLHASSRLHRVYAPSTHAIPVIRPLHSPSRIRMLKNVASRFGGIWNAKPRSEGISSTPKLFFRRSFISLQKPTDDIFQRPLRALAPPEDWQPVISKIVSNAATMKPARILVCGPKGSGKSTVCKLITNTLLTTPRFQSRSPSKKPRAMFLDLDPGQPEFSPPGDVSLTDLRSCNLSVPFTHPIVPPIDGSRVIRSHHFGSVSPRYNPHHYQDCALDLMHWFNQIMTLDPKCPLVVNCSGWTQGAGLDLLVQLINCTTATDVIYTSTTGPDEVVDLLATTCSRTRALLHRVSSQPFQDLTYSASSLRIMQTMSYFHLAEPEADNLRWDPYPLLAKPPIIVPYAGLQQALFAVMILGDEQNPEFFSSILDGSIVGIVLIEDDDAIYSEESQSVGSSIMDGAEAHNIPNIEQELEGAWDHSEDANGTNHDTRVAFSPHPNTTSQQGLPQHICQPDTPEHLRHAAIRYAPTNIPYLPPIDHYTPSLHPKYTRSLGQAIIRSIDVGLHAFHLLTPIPEYELRSLYQQKRKIVLVRGSLDLPTWAYKEKLEYERWRRHRHLNILREIEENTMNDDQGIEVEKWAERQPWVNISEAKRKGSAKVRRVRRDIRYRGHADVSTQANPA
ncbi:MAG: hypothetical protein Q9163_002844 [Psora crenata]